MPRYSIQSQISTSNLRSFLEGRAVERFIVDQFFRDMDEEDLVSAVLRVRAYERVNLYILGTYEHLCALTGLQPEEGCSETHESNLADCTCKDLEVSEDILVRTRGTPKVKF